MQTRLAALAFAAVSLAALPHVAAAQSAPIAPSAVYSCDFENSYCDFMEQSAVGDAPPSASRRSTIVATSRNGSSGVRLHTEPGDNSVHGSGTWERDDLEKAPDSSYCNEGQEEWWAVSVMYPSDYVFPGPGQGGVYIDFHHNSDSGLPNFSVEARGDSGLRISGYGGPSLNGGQYRVQIADPYGAVNNVTRNVWYDYVFHIKWSSSGSGLSEAWLNGHKILAYSGATLYSGISCYLKLANYHDATGQPSSIVYDRVVRGASAADVAIGPLEGVKGAPSPTTPAPSTPTASTPTTPTAPSSSGTGSSGNNPSSTTMDSSAYTIAAGQPVTFTVRVLGSASSQPSGNVRFSSDGNAIAACGAVALSSGNATCTTSSLSSGSHAITGLYSGDATYGAAQAGPITQTVSGSSASSAPSLPTKFGMDSSAYAISAGDTVTFTATIPGMGGSVAFNDNGSVIAGCASSSVSASGIATCSTNALAAGAHAITGLYSGNGSYAAGVAGPITQTVNAKSVSVGAASTGAFNVAGLWWGGLPESGWGVNLAQQGTALFATWFTYDAQGQGQWLVMSDVTMTGTNTYNGAVYRTTGPSFSTDAFNPSQVTRTQVGSATFVFGDANNATFTATVDGATVSKSITRLVFDPRMPLCTEGADAAASGNYQDLWWRASGTESGWGVNLAHQGDTMFMTWFTYGADGKGMWLSASNIVMDAPGHYTGTLFRTTGPAFNDPNWDASKVVRTAVGSASFAFSDGANGVFSYTVDGVSGAKPISRLQFAAPATVCRPA